MHLPFITSILWYCQCCQQDFFQDQDQGFFQDQDQEFSSKPRPRKTSFKTKTFVPLKMYCSKRFSTKIFVVTFIYLFIYFVQQNISIKTYRLVNNANVEPNRMTKVSCLTLTCLLQSKGSQYFHNATSMFSRIYNCVRVTC